MPTENTLFTCRCCALEKSISPEKSRFLIENGYEKAPMFCESCINARLDQLWETPGERRSAICTDCGCETRLNFVPCLQLPVYCTECYKNHSDEC